MDIISGTLFVGIVYLVLMTIFARILSVSVPLSMALALLGALILVAGNRQRINRWMQPSPRDKKRLSPRLRSGNRAARRSKH